MTRKIKVLDSAVSRLIAAGEVVERPASVVKELIENSIDSGSRTIRIEIESGGVASIKITDDGCGIERDSVKTAFLRHATSKLVTQDDLEQIETLGFRGEALASIAAVSKLSVVTRTKDEIAGTRYELEGAQEIYFDDEGCACGTTIMVRELFFNLPARMKFLKKDATEANAIASLVDKLALSHPEISFKFIKDGVTKLHTPGDGKLISAIYEVLGKDIAKAMLAINHEDAHLKLNGCILHPSQARASRGLEHFFVNGRYVKVGVMMAALEEGYKNQITQGKYPACVLNLTIPSALVDVNVHPAKTEVKFENDRAIYRLVHSAVKLTLQNSLQPTITRNPNELFKECDPNRPEFKEPTIAELREYQRHGLFENAPLLEEKIDKILQEQTGQAKKPDFLAEQQSLFGQLESEKAGPDVLGRLFFVGEILKTYVICQADDKMVLIDKHAAHENLLFEQLKQQSGPSSMQMLLVPPIVTLSRAEHKKALENKEVFEELGFEIDDFGEGSIIVRAVPLDLFEKDIELLIMDVVKKLDFADEELTSTAKEQMLYSIACKAAIKAHDKNNKAELMQLVEELNQKRGLLCCPHGRPVCCVVKRQEIERWFFRT